MIEKLKQTVRGFDDAPAIPTAIEFFKKINELVDAVNVLQTKVNKLAPNINFAQPEVKENMQKEPITLLDIFNEMGEMYSSLWNKMEDIHHDLKTKGGDNE